MRSPKITFHDLQQAEKLHARIAKAEKFNFEQLDQQSLVNDFQQLPEPLQEKAMELLQQGYPSPWVVDFIMDHSFRGRVQRLGEDDWLLRIELLRRNYVVFDEAVEERTAEDWRFHLGLTSPIATQGAEGTAHVGSELSWLISNGTRQIEEESNRSPSMATVIPTTL